MFTILEDRVGRHDFLLTPCSPETFEILYEGRTAEDVYTNEFIDDSIGVP